ncbi:hypothetical protein RHGRI_034896 [Rhododendron griersonianum]|uniref:Uncharacterized protein n=1 Tax=Rhododendron griersonianum TaxID=479676 RepID=A0AAV6I8G4_9ERIC|nr:hypothetical protein RHGRI_034896 [Rhododendron griersonianum]
MPTLLLTATLLLLCPITAPPPTTTTDPLPLLPPIPLHLLLPHPDHPHPNHDPSGRPLLSSSSLLPLTYALDVALIWMFLRCMFAAEFVTYPFVILHFTGAASLLLMHQIRLCSIGSRWVEEALLRACSQMIGISIGDPTAVELLEGME